MGAVKRLGKNSDQYFAEPAVRAAHPLVFPDQRHGAHGLGAGHLPSRASEGDDALVCVGHVCLAWQASCGAYQRAARTQQMVIAYDERPALEDIIIQLSF